MCCLLTVVNLSHHYNPRTEIYCKKLERSCSVKKLGQGDTILKTGKKLNGLKECMQTVSTDCIFSMRR